MSGDAPAFPPMVNNRILSCIKGEETDRVPVWIMRQAGRYLPEFREFRQKHGFFEICQNPELACEVTLMPIRRFNFDAAIIFSDILVIPQALGMEVLMNPAPTFPKPLTLDDVSNLKTEGVVQRLKYVGEAITLTRHKLNGEAVLYGFSGAPWTLMSYMIEGGGSKTYSAAKKWLYAHKSKARELLGILTDVVADYCVMQGKAGAQVIQLFDTNAEYLTKDIYTKYCIPGLITIRKKVREELEKYELRVPMVMFAKGMSVCHGEFVNAGFEVIGIDWGTEPIDVRSSIMPRSVCLQGNLDPCALYASPQDIRSMVYSMMKKFHGSKVIANLGHGIYPDTPLEGVEAFVKAVRSYTDEPSMSYSSESV